MNNGELQLSMGPASTIPGVKDRGNFFIAEDTGELYIDTSDEGRVKISDIVYLTTLTARNAVNSPISSKFYYVRETNTFYTYANETWKPVGSGAFTDSSAEVEADRLKQNITIQTTGDATGSASSNLGSDVSIALTLANSGVIPGAYGSSADMTATGGSTFLLPKFTVDAKGRITQIDTITVTMPSSMGLTGMVLAGTNTGTGNTASIANGYAFLNMLQDNSVVNSLNIVGRGATEVVGESGALVIKSDNDNTTYAAAQGISRVAADESAEEDYVFQHTNQITAGIASGSTGNIAFGGTVSIPKVSFDSNGHITAAETTTVTLPAPQNGTGITVSDGVINHSNSIEAGTAQGTSGTVGFGGTISIPTVTYDAQGHITATGTTTITLPSTPSDKDVKTETTNTDTFYVAGTTSSTGGDGTLKINSYLYNDADGLHAKKFFGDIDGTADKATKDAAGNNIQSTYAPLASPALTGTPTAPTAETGTNNTQLATTAFVANAIAAMGDTLVFKGTLGTGGTVAELPSAYKAGDEYKIVEAGTYAGNVCEVGDLIISTVTRTSGGQDTDWCVVQGNIDGAVTSGSAGSTDLTVTKPNASTIQVTHNASGVTAGTYGNSATTPAFGGTITIPKFTVSVNGHITSAEEQTVTLPSPQAGTGISVDGSTINHSNSVTAGTAQGTATGSVAFGGVISIPTVTFDAQGHITDKGTTEVTLPSPQAGTGISVSGGTINHSNAITSGDNAASAGSAPNKINIPTLNYDAQGHITGKTSNEVTLDLVPVKASTTEPSSNLVAGMLWFNFNLSTS